MQVVTSTVARWGGGLRRPLVLGHLALLCFPPPPELETLTLLVGTVPPQFTFSPTYGRPHPDLLVLQGRGLREQQGSAFQIHDQRTSQYLIHGGQIAREFHLLS